MEYRRKRLLERVGALERLLAGRDVALPSWTRPDGGYSELRTWALVEDLLDALEQYERYRTCQEDGDPALSELPYRMPEGLRKCCRGFLYCAVRLSASGHYWLCGAKGTFNDLLYMAEGIGYTDKTRLCFDELYDRPVMEGFFAWMDTLYEAFTGKGTETIVTEEERQAVQKRYKAEIEEREAVWSQELLSPEEQAEIDRQWYESLSDEERREVDEESEALAQEEQDKQAWMEAFPEKEMFCRQYLLFRRLYFQEAAWRTLPQGVEHLLDIYLYEQGASALLKDDAFFYTYALLGKVLKQAREAMGTGDA